jgi:hypothetical protein
VVAPRGGSRLNDVDPATVRAAVADEASKLHHLEPQAEGLEDGSGEGGFGFEDALDLSGPFSLELRI